MREAAEEAEDGVEEKLLGGGKGDEELNGGVTIGAHRPLARTYNKLTERQEAEVRARNGEGDPGRGGQQGTRPRAQ
eukprot:6723817-Pyramimonas_sp.AAC.1